MRKNAKRQEQPKNLKKKLMSALAMLLVATTLMTTTSYAWFILSTAPEVTGIETQVGANGSLEIALLNTETRADMSTIRAGIGDSLAANNLAANNAWGNLIDLGYVDYGLGSLLLLPARLNVVANGEDYTVDPGLLSIPTYGYDGRIVELTEDTTSAIYRDQEFAFIYGQQDYGVRAIGTSNALSVQGSALANAQSNVSTYTKSAQNMTVSTLSKSNNGEGLFNIVMKYSMSQTYDETDRGTLLSMLEDLDKSLEYIDLALREGLVAYAASAISEEDTFTAVKNQIMDTSVELPELLQSLSAVGTVPDTFTTWVNKLDEMQNDLNVSYNACVALTGGSYTWDQIKPILTSIFKVDAVYIEGSLIKDLDINSLLMLESIEMTLAPGSGLLADVADFTGNYSQSDITYAGKSVIIVTASAVNPAYLAILSTLIGELEPASGGETVTAMPLSATYGYALDLAFRCNAAQPDLVLQTKGVQRVYSGENEGDVVSTSGSTQGGGSYMEFSSKDDALSLEQRLRLMDAIRVGFVDDQGGILGIAKLNVTSREVVDGVVRAPLYLYDYTFEEDEAGLYLSMGERRLTDNLITPLEQNIAKAVTAIVWLDGDIVDNTMVSATESASLNGVLNLQFATTAELVPAVDGTLLNYTADKTGLQEAIDALAETAAAGQGTYTNVSWNAFITAYNRAVSVNENSNACVIEIRNAVNSLAAAALQLEEVSKDAVNSKIEEIRELMGSIVGDTARYVITDGEGGYTSVDDNHTDEEKGSWDVQGTIDSVDHNNNKVDEGNGIYTTLYSDESWNALAAALYEAEAVAMNPNATDDEINAALTALENAQKALSRQVFFKPYEYMGDIYYEAICESENADTYGKWYDSSFKRIVADVTILNLDAYAQPATISEIGQEAYVSSDAEYITPDIAFLEQVFPELRDVQVKGVKWNDVDSELFTELMHQYHYDKLSELTGMADTDPVLNVGVTGSTADALSSANAAAKAVLAQWEASQEVTAQAAETAIADLNDAIVAHYKVGLAANAQTAGETMTANQRILLSGAVNSAKSVEGFKDTTNTALNGLRKAAADAEKLLGSTEVVTGQQALEALEALNEQLSAVGKDAIGGHTLIQTLPEGFDAGDIVYDVQYPGIQLKLTGKSGHTTIGAQILTEDGVVLSVSKSITIYDMADGVKIKYAGNETASLSLSAEGTADLTAELFWEEGGINTGDKKLEELVLEEVRRYTWASTDTTVLTVAGKEAGTCTVTALKAGTAKITVSIETVSGNFYTYEIPVIVTES